ncbi:MAG: hypothetical protein U0228_08860 [Myxococcaceae bacterium]
MTEPVPAHVLHLVRTACLVESRASSYSRYLARVFEPRGWSPVFERWGAEEEHHGRALGTWLGAHDPHFDVDATFTRYLSLVPYHSDESESVYGSEQGELVARCFVEAMAATYYQAVGAGAVDAPALRAVCKRLAADEARHYTMFRRLLEQLRAGEGAQFDEARAVVWRRLRSLSDEQIITASWLARGAPGTFSLTREAWFYRLQMARLYRPRHARFVWRLVRPLVTSSHARGGGLPVHGRVDAQDDARQAQSSLRGEAA